MPPLALALVLTSTGLHAGWNLLARRQRAEALFFHRMLALIAVGGLVPAALSEWWTRSLPLEAWIYAGTSGVFCALYYLFLARAYASSDFTIVYPLARALPVLMVGLGDIVWGRPPTPMGWIGMALVTAGCLLAPLTSWREITLARYLNRTTVWVVLTALGTVGYSLLDKAAAEIVRPGPATAARYGYVFYLASYLVYALLIRIAGEGRGRASKPAIGWRWPLLGGLFSFGAYWLVLWAYQLSRQASYVVAFRQFSIAIGVGFAFAIYREPGVVIRSMAALLITAGLVIIGLWGNP